MIVECPACNTIFPVDPKKVPTGGIHARCSVCVEVFFVAPPPAQAEVLETLVEGIGPEVEVSEPLTGEPETDAPIVDPVETLPNEVVEADVAATGNDGVGVEIEGESEASFEIERELSFEEREFSFGMEVGPDSAEEPHQGFAPESPLQPEPEPVFESAEATFQRMEDSVVASAEPSQEETAGVEEDFSTAIESDTVEVVEEVIEAPVELPEGPTISAPAFGKRDPMEKAQRLARVLVSDIILYNPDRHHAATETGRVKEEFEEEIQKSWSEYVEQVGDEIANTTPYFSNALNEILAKGQKIF